MHFALAIDGFRLAGYEPRVINERAVLDGALVVAIDTELPDEVTRGAPHVETWIGFPPMREQYFPSRAAAQEPR